MIIFEDIVNDVKNRMGKEYTSEDEKTLFNQLKKHGTCDEFDVYDLDSIVYIDCEDCGELIWSSDLKNRNTDDKLLTLFKNEIDNKFEVTIDESSEKIIIERLKEHSKCVENGHIEIARYGNSNISLECVNCSEVILDSDLIMD